MAERSNPEQRISGGADEQGRTTAPDAPGAVVSPQMPGEVPDRSTVPGHHSVSVARATSVRRPLIEAGTAQGIMRPYASDSDRENDPSRFNRANPSFEELRKADPALLPPSRPTPGYALDAGQPPAPALVAGAAAAEETAAKPG